MHRCMNQPYQYNQHWGDKHVYLPYIHWYCHTVVCLPEARILHCIRKSKSQLKLFWWEPTHIVKFWNTPTWVHTCTIRPARVNNGTTMVASVNTFVYINALISFCRDCSFDSLIPFLTNAFIRTICILAFRLMVTGVNIFLTLVNIDAILKINLRKKGHTESFKGHTESFKSTIVSSPTHEWNSRNEIQSQKKVENL